MRAACLLLLLTVSARAPVGEVTAYKAARILTGTGAPIADGVILVENGKIVAIGAGIQIPDAAKVVDLGGATVIPGLVDANLVLWLDGMENEEAREITPEYRVVDGLNPKARDLKRALQSGVTSAFVGPGNRNVIGGLAAHYGGRLAPGLVAAGLSIANFLSARTILVESLATEHRRTRPLFDLAHMGDAVVRPRLRPLMLVWLIAPFAFAGYTVVLPLHTKAAFGWTEKDLAWLFAIIGATAAVIQGYAFGRLERRAGPHLLFVAGLFGMAVCIAALPMVGSTAGIYLWTVPMKEKK